MNWVHLVENRYHQRIVLYMVNTLWFHIKRGNLTIWVTIILPRSILLHGIS
jgi:hypothetical protein